MSEIKRWATEFLDAVDGQDVGFWMRSLARAVISDADTSPARQERDEDGLLERAIDRANDTKDGTCMKCGATGFTLDTPCPVPDARPSGGEYGEPFRYVIRPEPDSWVYRKWVSGGEGAPEPDDRAILRRLYGAAIGNAVYPSVDWTDCATKDYQHLCDRLPPELEACSTCTEGQPPYFCRECVHGREEGLRGALEAEARDGPETMERAWNHREAEIRADERRKVEAEYEPADDLVDWVRADETRKVLQALTMGATYAEILARLSPTDEQESPNRSDEP